MDKALMKKITKVQATHTEDLMAKANVVGLAVGMKQTDGEVTDQLCLVVMVGEKLPEDELNEDDLIPAEIDDILTDVQEMGFLQAF